MALSLAERHTLSQDPTFVGRIRMAATSAALAQLQSQTPDPAGVATARVFLREPGIWAQRVSVMAASVVEGADVDDETLTTLISNAWPFLSATFTT